MESSPAPPAMPVAVEPAVVAAPPAPPPARVTLTVVELAQAPPAVLQSASAPAAASPAEAATEARFTIVFVPLPPSIPVAVASAFVEVFASDTPASSAVTAVPLAPLRAEAVVAARVLVSSPPPGCVAGAPGPAGALGRAVTLA